MVRAHGKGIRRSGRAMTPTCNALDGPAEDRTRTTLRVAFFGIGIAIVIILASAEVGPRHPARAHWPSAEVERLGLEVFGNESSCEEPLAAHESTGAATVIASDPLIHRRPSPLPPPPPPPPPPPARVAPLSAHQMPSCAGACRS